MILHPLASGLSSLLVLSRNPTTSLKIIFPLASSNDCYNLDLGKFGATVPRCRIYDLQNNCLPHSHRNHCIIPLRISFAWKSKTLSHWPTSFLLPFSPASSPFTDFLTPYDTHHYVLDWSTVRSQCALKVQVGKKKR